MIDLEKPALTLESGKRYETSLHYREYFRFGTRCEDIRNMKELSQRIQGEHSGFSIMPQAILRAPGELLESIQVTGHYLAATGDLIRVYVGDRSVNISH